MSICIGTPAAQCCCSKARVKWCPHCKKWICRHYIDWHECVKHKARANIIAALKHRISLELSKVVEADKMIHTHHYLDMQAIEADKSLEIGMVSKSTEATKGEI